MTPLSPTTRPPPKNESQPKTQGGPPSIPVTAPPTVSTVRPPPPSKPQAPPKPRSLPPKPRGVGGRTFPPPSTTKRGRGRPIGGSLNNNPMSTLVAAAQSIHPARAAQEQKKKIVQHHHPSWNHPALADDNSLDSEYAKFVRGLINDDDEEDDKSLMTFKTLPSVRTMGENGGRLLTTADNASSLPEIVGDGGMGDIVLDRDNDGDDEDYRLTSDEEEDDDDDDDEDDEESKKDRAITPLEEFDLDNVFGEIEGLFEEDLDAQLTSLLQTELLKEKPQEFTPTTTNKQIAVAGTEQQIAITSPGQSTKKKKSTQTVVTTPTLSPGTAVTTTAQVTRQQLKRLRETMAQHHQLLLQQATLAVRAAYVQRVSKERGRPSNLHQNQGALPTSMLNSRQLTFCAPGYMGRDCGYENDFYHGENAEELAECLDGAVGMLQDLEQNWKDAVRNSIQLSYRGNTHAPTQKGLRRSLMPSISEKTESIHDKELGDANNNTLHDGNNSSERRLTRSAFTKTLLDREKGISEMNDGESSMMLAGVSAAKHRNSVFDIRGLSRLRETFSAIDNSVKEVRMEEMKDGNGGINILHPTDHGVACELLLRHAGAEVNEKLVPGKVDLSELFTHAPEAFAEPEKVHDTLTKAQRLELRRNKNQFTSGEDNLILRGVNLYGEKEWVLVSDRFLPDRAVNGISQRYHRLCFLIYKSNGIFIDDDGKLAPLPTFKKGSIAAEDDAASRTQEAIQKIKPPAAPTTMNVHRWTMEEDVAILKAVPMMGNQWAEICNHIIPHRDRGHIRKRYQVLERRIPKGTTKMNLKRPAMGELVREAVKYAKTSVMPKTTQKPPTSQKKTAAKRTNGSEKKVKAKTTSKPASTIHASSVPSAQPLPSRPTSSFEVTIDEDDEKIASLLHRLSTPQRSSQEHRPLSHDRDAAKDLAYILNGHENSNVGGDITRMGLEKILENDWSQESGMQRLLDARLADESKPNYSPIKSSHLSNIDVGDTDSSRLSMINEFNAADDSEKNTTSSNHGARRSLLSSAIQKTQENTSKRKRVEAPPERSVKVSGSPVKVNLGSYVSSPPAPASAPSPAPSPTQENIFAESFSLAAAYGHLTPRTVGTPGKPDTPGIEGEKSQLNDEAFRYFMSDGSPLKSMTPSKLQPNTPLNYHGFNAVGISGPVDAGNNSLFMAGDDFDCVSALQDLSNSAPPTPSKLLLPARITQTGGKSGNASDQKSEHVPPKPKTSFLSKVKAKVGESSQRKTS